MKTNSTLDLPKPTLTKEEKKKAIEEAVAIARKNQKLEEKYWNTKQMWSRREIIELLQQEGLDLKSSE